MMRPPPWRFMWGMASRDMRAKNSRDRCSAVAHCSSVAVKARARGGPPELLTRMSRRPNRLVAAAIRSRIVWWLSRSPARARTSLPVASRISFAVRSRSVWVRLHTTTLAPSSASTSAQARPRPLLAPPTTATLSLSSRSMEAAPFPARRAVWNIDRRRTGTILVWRSRSVKAVRAPQETYRAAARRLDGGARRVSAGRKEEPYHEPRADEAHHQLVSAGEAERAGAVRNRQAGRGWQASPLRQDSGARR